MDRNTDLTLRAGVELQKFAAGQSINFGVTLILFIPIVLVATVIGSAILDSLWPLMLGGVYTLFGGLFGVISLGIGIGQHRAAARELRELDATRQLPAARVVRS